jgi:hypothetical protein
LLKLIKHERLNWFKSIDNDLKAERSKLCKYVSSLRKHNSYAINLDVSRTYVVELVGVGEVFSDYFQSVYKTLPREEEGDGVAVTLVDCPVILSNYSLLSY